jgi:hypothetical protein
MHHIIDFHCRPRTNYFVQWPRNRFLRPEEQRAQASARIGIEVGSADQPGLIAIGVQCVELDKRQITVVLRERESRQGEHFADGLRIAHLRGKVT